MDEGKGWGIMFERFFPDETVASTYDIDFKGLYEQGYRGILFDIDNTLVEHGMAATEQAVELFARLKELGFECCLISNNKKERVSSFNEKIGAHMIFNAHKPGKKSYYYAMELMGTDKSNPINKREEIQIVIKRFFEKIILKEYRSKKKGKKDEGSSFGRGFWHTNQ